MLDKCWMASRMHFCTSNFPRVVFNLFFFCQNNDPLHIKNYIERQISNNGYLNDFLLKVP